jgi:hypothetical protein
MKMQGIRLFRKSETGWDFIETYLDWDSLYAANPDAVDGLRDNKKHKVELEKPTEIEPSPILLKPAAPKQLPEVPENERAYIRRQLKDWRIAYVSKSEIDGLHWDMISGGVHVTSPQPFIHGYVSCDRIHGEFGHSCIHGEGPHRIKVLLTKKDNSETIFDWAYSLAGPKPSRNKRAS